MKALFAMRTLGFVRNFEAVLCTLAERGHSVHVVFDAPGKFGELDRLHALASRHPRLTYGKPTDHSGRQSFVWDELEERLRASLDLFGYLDPVYDDAPALRERARDRTPRAVSWLAEAAGPRGRTLLRASLRALERCLPCDPAVGALLDAERPDVVLITPLLWFGSPQVDYVRAARERRVPTMLCVGSWDHLSSKGTLYELPDRIAVWNERQRDEAQRRHGVPEQRIEVTGAHSYDHWFSWKPRPRETFCRRVGLDATRPYLLYVGSSRFIAKGEAGFVKEWVQRLRDPVDGLPSDVGILVRPHPQNAKRGWGKLDFPEPANTVIWPRGGTNPVAPAAKQDYFDSLYHSAGVVGLNTSALIEAGIVGRPVYSLLAPGSDASLAPTLHFRHLTDAGLLRVARDLEEHVAQLAAGLSEDPGPENPNRAFVESFVRPLGIETPAAPVLVDAIERCARQTISAPRHSRALPVVRALLYPAAACVRALRPPRRRRPVEEKAAEPEDILTSRADSRPTGIQDEHVRRASEGLRDLLRPLSEAHDPIIVGPWLSEVGFELLYWIPFLRWIVSKGLVDPSRLVALSRGGVSSWYGGICSRYHDIFEILAPADFARENAARVEQIGQRTMKQIEVCAFERTLAQEAARRLGLERHRILHPSVMYSFFLPAWRGERLPGFVEAFLSHAGLDPPIPSRLPELPEEYLAVKFYANESFPLEPANQAFVRDFVAAASKTTDVVLLDTGLAPDDHQEFDLGSLERVHRLHHWMDPVENLAVQSYVVSRARGFAGTYGGFSYLAPLYRVDSISFYSHPRLFQRCHLELAQRAFTELGAASYVVLATKDAGPLRSVLDLSRRGSDRERSLSRAGGER